MVTEVVIVVRSSQREREIEIEIEMEMERWRVEDLWERATKKCIVLINNQFQL